MIHEEYKTTDIILAAVLKMNSYEMVAIEKNGNKGTFIFRDIPRSIIKDYDLGKVLVEPVIFNNAIKQLTTSVRRID
jgi:hypothetical protein